MGLAALPFVLGILCVNMVLRLPVGPTLFLTEWPSLAWLYLQIIYAALTKGKARPAEERIPQIEVGATPMYEPHPESRLPHAQPIVRSTRRASPIRALARVPAPANLPCTHAPSMRVAGPLGLCAEGPS